MKMLAVDDDPLSLDLLETLIAQIGSHEIVKSESAEAALEIINQEPSGAFDCILLDIRMPGTDGIELCKLIREIPIYKRTPILMVTQMSDKANIDSAFAAGATDYLTKPFEISELRGRLQIIESFLEDRRANVDKIFAAKSLQADSGIEAKIDLLAPVEIIDVKGVVEYHVLENYVAQLSRKSLFGSTVTAMKIVNFEKHHQKASAADLGFLITDVAEAISDALLDTTFLMAYSGNGTYVCVLEGGWRPDTNAWAKNSCKNLEKMGLCLTGGEPLHINLYGGPAVRLISRVGARAVDALSEAQENAEKAYEASTADGGFFGVNSDLAFWNAS